MSQQPLSTSHPWGPLMRRLLAMRESQREYYRKRTNEALAKAIKLEVSVDDALQKFFDAFPNERPQNAAQTKLL